MTELRDGWRTQIVTDIERDGLICELLNPTEYLVDEVFRSDRDKTVVVKTCDGSIPLCVFQGFLRAAVKNLDPFEDGTSFQSAGVVDP